MPRMENLNSASNYFPGQVSPLLNEYLMLAPGKFYTLNSSLANNLDLDVIPNIYEAKELKLAALAPGTEQRVSTQNPLDYAALSPAQSHDTGKSPAGPAETNLEPARSSRHIQSHLPGEHARSAKTEKPNSSTDHSKLGKQVDLESARGALLDAASKNLIEAGKFSNFESEMTTFERRMKNSPEEIAQTYEQIARILNTPTSIMSDASRMLLAEEVMQEAALPASHQGLTDDCFFASLQIHAYTDNPGETAKLIADAALKGSITTTSGQVVKITDGISAPLPGDGDAVGQRNFADQVFQVAAINTDLALLNRDNGTHERYSLTPSSTPGLPPNERIYLGPTDQTGYVAFNGINEYPNRLLYELIGSKENMILLNQTSLPQLEQTLHDLQTKNGLPISVSLVPQSPMTQTDLSIFLKSAVARNLEKLPGLSVGPILDEGHVVSIESYDQSSGTVTYWDPMLNKSMTTDMVSLAKSLGINNLDPELRGEFDNFIEKASGNPDPIFDFISLYPANQRALIREELIAMGEMDPDDLSTNDLSNLGIN